MKCRDWAGTAPDETGAISCLVVSITLKKGGCCISEMHGLTLGGPCEMMCSRAAIHPSICMRCSSCKAL